MRLGAHVSIAGGIYHAFDRARSIGCETAQIFVKPNRSWGVKPLSAEDISLFKSELNSAPEHKKSIHPVVAHASYLLNLGSPDRTLWERSRNMLIVELERCEALNIPWLVIHPGSHRGTGEEAGIERISNGLSEVHKAAEGFRARILIETTAGQTNAIGHRFEQIARLIEGCYQGERLGVCFDTCHVFAAGYDIRSQSGYEATLAALDVTVGLDQVKVIHLNDSKGELGCHKDRHEHIGAGHIGLAGFWNILHDERLTILPGILETPKSADLHEDVDNLATLRRLMSLPSAAQECIMHSGGSLNERMN